MSQSAKMKALRKYLGHKANAERTVMRHSLAGITMQDNDQIGSQSPFEDKSSSQEPDHRKKRIYSGSESGEEAEAQEKQRQRNQKQIKKEKKLKKKLQKALGIGKQEDIEEFMANLQVEGISKQEILEHLKASKGTIQPHKLKLEANQVSSSKFDGYEEHESSDLEIPEHARTIYRNKDGSIKQHSDKVEKEKRKEEVLSRLGEWEKGMQAKKQSEDEDEDVERAKNNRIWDDPMRRWEPKTAQQFLTCKFDGPPNRFDIKPGYRWDGVLRGNCFENKYLQEINARKAKKQREHMAYMKQL